MSSKSRRSLQDIIQQRRKGEFVGRTEQLALFRENLSYSPEDERRRFIFEVWGQGGVGKTTLLQRFRQIAEEAGAVTAWTDEAETNVPQVLGHFVKQLKQQGHELEAFAERYKVYRQKKEELEADPSAPQGFTAFATKTVAKAGVRVARRTPVGGVLFDFVDEETLAEQASEWVEFVRRRLTNKDEVRLILQPVEVLTPLFLKALRKIGEEHAIALFFDTYEHTLTFLDPWLRSLIEGRYGDVPIDAVFTISGREELDRNHWLPYDGITARLPLEQFTEKEARAYLARKEITDKEVIDAIIKLSGRLPLLMATLAVESPDDPTGIGEATGTAVERFLKWVDQPQQRRAALDGALPRYLNRDVLALLIEKENVSQLFAWLIEMPFVLERPEGWTYHETVRHQMLRHKRRAFPQEWIEQHERLVAYHRSRCDELHSSMEEGVRDTVWIKHALEALYHQICRAPHERLTYALNGFLAAFKARRSFAHQWARIIHQAGEDTDEPAFRSWGRRLIDGLVAYEAERYEESLEVFESLLDYSELEPSQRAVVLAWQGDVYFLIRQYDKALPTLQQALELDPGYISARIRRGILLRNLARYDEALSDFNHALEQEPNNGRILASRGITYSSMERYEKALDDLNRAIKIDDELAWAIMERGVIYRRLGKLDAALTDFRSGISLNPDLKHTGQMEIGLVMRDRNEHEKSINAFLAALTAEPSCPDCWSSLIERYETLYARKQVIELIMTAEVPNVDTASVIASRAEAMRRKSYHTEALDEFSRAIEMDSSHVLAHLSRGEIYRELKHYEKALADFDQAVELDSNSPFPVTHRGIVYSLMEHYEEALDDFNRAIELDPSLLFAVANRGIAYMRKGDYEQAAIELDRAVELGPEHGWVFFHRGITQRHLGHYEQALADLKRSASLDNDFEHRAQKEMGLILIEARRYREAAESFLSALCAEPSCPDCWGSLIETYERLHPPDQVIQLIRSANVPSADTASVIASRAEAMRQRGYNVEALTDFNRAIEIDSNNYLAYLSRGEIYQELEHFEDALVDFDRAVELEPKSPFASFMRGETARELGRYEEAIADFGRVVELDPDSSIPLINRGILNTLTEHYEKALADFNKAIELDSESSFPFVHRGIVYSLMESYEKALADFDIAIVLDPESDWAIFHRAETFRKLKRYDAALEDYTQALALDPENDWLYYSRAITYQALEQPLKAESDFNEAIQIADRLSLGEPDSWQAKLNIFVYLLASGDHERAEQLYQQTMPKEPPLPAILDALHNLNQYLDVFPDNVRVKTMRDRIQQHLEERGDD